MENPEVKMKEKKQENVNNWPEVIEKETTKRKQGNKAAENKLYNHNQ